MEPNRLSDKTPARRRVYRRFRRGPGPESAPETGSPVPRTGGLGRGLAIGCLGPMAVGGVAWLAAVVVLVGLSLLRSLSLTEDPVVPALVGAAVVGVVGMAGLGAFARASLGTRMAAVGMSIALLGWTLFGVAMGPGSGLDSVVIGFLLFPGLALVGWFLWPRVKALAARRSTRRSGRSGQPPS